MKPEINPKIKRPHKWSTPAAFSGELDAALKNRTTPEPTAKRRRNPPTNSKR
jgi:hypothetical protein